MTRIRKFLTYEYKISRGLLLYFIAVAVAIQLLWPAFANPWTGSAVIVAGSVCAAVVWRVARWLQRDKGRTRNA